MPKEKKDRDDRGWDLAKLIATGLDTASRLLEIFLRR